MNGITAAIVAALCIGIVTLIVAMISRFLGRFNEETRRIADEMRRAQDSDEYIYWQSRLHRHYIRLLPFVSEKAAGRIYSRLFRKPKHSAEKEHSDGLFHILAPSVLSVCLCAVCLCGMSWAWFTATGNTGVSKIQAATYTATVTATRTVEVDNATKTETLTADQNGEITFTNAGQYSITIQIGGTATIGYCKVKLGDMDYYTEGLAQGSTLTFTFNAAINQTLTVTPQWGTYSGTANIKDGDSIGTPSNALSLTANSLTENVEEAVEEKAVSDTTQTDSEIKKGTDNTESSPVPKDTTAEETDKSNVEKGKTAAEESSTTTPVQSESADIETSPASEAATSENTTATQIEPSTPAESESN